MRPARRGSEGGDAADERSERRAEAETGDGPPPVPAPRPLRDSAGAVLAVMRQYVPADAPALARAANHAEVAAHLRDAFPHPYTVDDAEGFIAMAMSAEPRTLLTLADPEDDAVIGGIGLHARSDVHRGSMELGYWITPAQWGRGIATAAVRELTELAFRTLDVDRIDAGVYAPNRASMRVLERAGFEREGVLRASVRKGGRVLDQVVHARVHPRLTHRD